jgi:hypothetical protein
LELSVLQSARLIHCRIYRFDCDGKPYKERTYVQGEVTRSLKGEEVIKTRKKFYTLINLLVYNFIGVKYQIYTEVSRGENE